MSRKLAQNLFLQIHSREFFFNFLLRRSACQLLSLLQQLGLICLVIQFPHGNGKLGVKTWDEFVCGYMYASLVNNH